MPVTPEEFKGALRRFASGVTIITTRVGDVDHGMTASAFTSVSLDPPRVLVCVARKAAMHDLLASAGAFGVTLLAEDQRELSDRFAWKPSPDRFAGLDVARAPESGAAWLSGGLAWLDCSVCNAFDGGDHTIYVGEVRAARVGEGAQDASLLYVAGRYRRVGDAL